MEIEYDSAKVASVARWIESERKRMEESRYKASQYPYTAGYIDCLDFVEERLRKAYKGAPAEDAGDG